MLTQTPSTVMKPIQDLGALIEGRWRHRNYNEDLFPEIAGGALAEANLIEQIDPWEDAAGWAEHGGHLEIRDLLRRD
jgi:hypothetical protein